MRDIRPSSHHGCKRVYFAYDRPFVRRRGGGQSNESGGDAAENIYDRYVTISQTEVEGEVEEGTSRFDRDSIMQLGTEDF